MPATYSKPLSEDFLSDGDKLLALVDKVWKFEENDAYSLETWQRDLIRRVLERYPDDHPDFPGELRYRQVLISLGRQNGKSVLGAVFGLYGLLLQVPQGSEVISLASTVQQANIIYKKVAYVINSHPALSNRFKTTGTRGIRSREVSKPAQYQVKAGNGDSLQGATVTMCLFDEVHISKEEAWDAMVFGTSARRNGMVLGITTAGDDDSVLLKRLYEVGRKAAGGEGDERFGFFLWEAPAHLDIDDPDALRAANPAIASGRIPVQQELSVIRSMPEHSARRFRLNQFVSAENIWMPLNKWLKVSGKGLPKDKKYPVIFAVDRSPNWDSATISAATKLDGKVYTEVVASMVNPNIEWLTKVCVDLWTRYSPEGFYMDSNVLKDLSTHLREQGIPVEYLTQVQMMNASATAYSLVAEQRVEHGNDPIVNRQMPRAVTENAGDGFKVSRRKSAGQIDGVISTVISIYAAENMKEAGPALFFMRS